MSENQHDELNFFSLLSDSEQHLVRESMTEKKYKDGVKLDQDDLIYLLKQGHFKANILFNLSEESIMGIFKQAKDKYLKQIIVT